MKFLPPPEHKASTRRRNSGARLCPLPRRCHDPSIVLDASVLLFVGILVRLAASGIALLACIAVTRLDRVGLIVLLSSNLVSPGTAELVQSYTLYVNMLFLLVATAGLILMAQEQADRGAPATS